jgi:phage portal protein BeeE
MKKTRTRIGMNNAQKASEYMRQTFMDYVPQVVEKLKFIKKPMTLESVRRLAKAKHVGFDLSDEDIQKFLPLKLSDRGADFARNHELLRSLIASSMGVPNDTLKEKPTQLSLF